MIPGAEGEADGRRHSRVLRRARLPRRHQGGGRWRRHGHARGPRGRRARRRAGGGAARGGGRVRRRPRARRALSGPHAPRRGPGARRPPRRVVHLGERECSLQRRHQKVVEEAPSPAVGARCARGWATRRSRSREPSATRAPAPSSSSATRGFFFLEMNTRLQVEHPVTEAVFGVDLVEEQLRVAAGEPLRLRQGRADPARARRRGAPLRRGPGERVPPSGGRIAAAPAVGRGHPRRRGRADRHAGDRALRPAAGQGHQRDGPDRATALARLDRALADTAVGVATSTAFTRALLHDPDVRAGDLDTTLLERRLIRS